MPNNTFRMIDNYVYLYHTKTLVALPTYPESLVDSIGAEFNQTSPLSRSAPIFSYVKSGPRSVQVTLQLHRDMLNDINISSSKLNIPDLSNPDYIDILIGNLQSMALPKYAAAEKMVDPPLIAVRFGQQLFIKGVVIGEVSVTYSGPILANDKYALADVSFTVNEVDPYDAVGVAKMGSMRGFSKDLERGWGISH